ncbi:hypothetical protein [Burkholderia pseudomallei]|uniref:hypothetical protein n=1 Tax=Burkholderia pseudomallei TaxID=28450 RepID=UPI0011C4DD3A|nr:hypothetical protein [Burkholderia pseudomallei]
MSNVDDEQPVLWRARACAGENLPCGISFLSLSVQSRKAEVHNVRRFLPTLAAQHLAAMLVNLSEASRLYCPLETLAKFELT